MPHFAVSKKEWQHPHHKVMADTSWFVISPPRIPVMTVVLPKGLNRTRKIANETCFLCVHHRLFFLPTPFQSSEGRHSEQQTLRQASSRSQALICSIYIQPLTMPCTSHGMQKAHTHATGPYSLPQDPSGQKPSNSGASSLTHLIRNRGRL